MNSYLTEFIRGVSGRFRRSAEGSVECVGIALADDPMAVARLALGQDPYPPDVVKALVPRPEPIPARAAAVTQTVVPAPASVAHLSDGEVKRRYAELKAQQEQADAEKAAGFVTRRCARCKAEFETREPSVRKVCADCAGHLR